jgi:hypothetical protein
VPTIPASLAPFTAAIQSAVDAIAACGHAVFDALAAPVKPMVDPITTALEVRGPARMAQGGLVGGAPVVAGFDTVAAAVEPVLDPFAAQMQPMLDPVATLVQPMLDAVAAVGGHRRARGQQQQDARNPCEKDGLHGVLLRRNIPAGRTTQAVAPG